jgi:ATP/maltotriose-dependent transcriptional regulator MalT
VLWSEAEAWDGVVAILEEHGHAWIYSGRVRFVADWLAKLPAGRVENAPSLTYLAALTRQRHDAAEAVRSLEETSTRLRKMGDHAQSSAALIDAVIISQNENLAQAARRLLPRLLSLRRLATDRGACWR